MFFGFFLEDVTNGSSVLFVIGTAIVGVVVVLAVACVFHALVPPFNCGVCGFDDC